MKNQWGKRSCWTAMLLFLFLFFAHHAVIYLIQITEAVCCSARVTSCVGQFLSKPLAKMHSGVQGVSIISRIYEIASGKHEICLLHWDQSERHIYLFLLSPQGHCFHGDSLMASFASLFLIFFFTPLPSYLQYLCLKTPHDRCGSGPPSSPHQLFFAISSLPPTSLSRHLWKT